MRFPVLLLSGVVLFYAQNVSALEVTCPVFVETEPYTAVLKSFVQPQWRVSPRQEPRQWLTHIGVTQDKPENFGDLHVHSKDLFYKQKNPTSPVFSGYVRFCLRMQ